MSFSPDPDRYYRIYFKHSGKCLDGRTIHRGEFIQQADADLGSDSQLWRFRRLTDRHYGLMTKKSGKSLDVRGGSHSDGAELIQWDPSDQLWNEHFRLIPAGDETYYITVRHSGKRICAKDATTSSGANVVQWSEGKGAHFRFRIVPDGDSDKVFDRALIADSNAKMRGMIIGIASKMPKYGSGLAFMLNLLWPAEDPQQRLWEQMKRYVQDLVRDMIAQERLTRLANQLSGIKLALAAYTAENDGSPLKAGYFTALLTILNTAEPDFFDERDPEKTLPYFIALGTIRLAMLRDLFFNYKLIFLKDDDNPALHLQQLQEKIDKFSRAAKLARERAATWRLTRIRLDHQTERFGISTVHHWSVIDDYDGFKRTWSYNDTTSEDKRAESYARKGLEMRKIEAASQYQAELDTFFGPARLWRYLDPAVTAKPTTIASDLLTGPFGGVSFNAFQDGVGHRRITAIQLHAGDRIDGIEVFYDGKSGGLHGGRGGHMLRLDLDAAKAETIVGVWGRNRGPLAAVYFTTSEGRTFGGGFRDADLAEWAGDPPENTGAVLHSIGGLAGTGHIEALSFTWRYERDE